VTLEQLPAHNARQARIVLQALDADNAQQEHIVLLLELLYARHAQQEV
jgi:hypothetical protein